jgi:hypothetical protein
MYLVDICHLFMMHITKRYSSICSASFVCLSYRKKIWISHEEFICKIGEDVSVY